MSELFKFNSVPVEVLIFVELIRIVVYVMPEIVNGWHVILRICEDLVIG